LSRPIDIILILGLKSEPEDIMNHTSKTILVFFLSFCVAFLCCIEASAAGYQVQNSSDTVSYSQLSKQQTEFPSVLNNFDFYIDSTKATNHVDLIVGAGEFRKSTTAFSLESGEIVKLNLSYSPQNTSPQVGLVGPDGVFRYVSGANGNFQKKIIISKTGKYYLAFRNYSNVSVHIMGFVYS